ncbi:hypothetical protein [Chitinophaga qingshengii]|uniref:Ferritin-like domain-containing protein n=1 Tax=Chitinophaga qingshengii TaxID=1569794 RepID=A0ABR7TR51_9BACT|nr:hypothetical protein [Chitinophaga qingshengii]MBC9932942.1 hypothetical protein [Chitinophaga qingshengii]
MQALLQHIVGHNDLHAKWLNTLSFMENAGARKISACEHPSLVDFIQLKHAAEEHRHAYYLKKQIAKVSADTCKTYQLHELLAPHHTRHYLHQLDTQTCRYLKNTFGLEGSQLKYAAYLFVTYAIEVRADALYPVYQSELDKAGSKVMVRSIILEEEGHLEEMINQLKGFAPDWETHAQHVQTLEQQLFDTWLAAIGQELAQYAA